MPELLHDFLRIFTDTKEVLGEIFGALGSWTYVVLFAIVFAETGLVIMPLLPGDSLLFATGALCGMGHLDVWTASVTIFCAALVGDNLNYRVGRAIGPRRCTRVCWWRRFPMDRGKCAMFLALMMTRLRVGLWKSWRVHSLIFGFLMR